MVLQEMAAVLPYPRKQRPAQKHTEESLMLRWMTAITLFVFSTAALAISPYFYGDKVSGANLRAIATTVEGKLKGEGFKVVGKYFPKQLPDYAVVIVTDDKMLAEVADVGGNAVLGAAIRVGIKSDGTVSYTNPDYWYRAYFRKGFDKKESTVKALDSKLQKALGQGEGFGGDETAKNLGNYRYMIGMERLDSYKNKLASYESHAEALKVVRENLAKNVGKTAKVYEITLPQKKLAVFGVAMQDDAMGDGIWMKKIEQENSVAGLPYEIFVIDGEVHSPHARFRVALAFPQVGMGQFMRIASLPNEVIATMSAVAGVEKQSSQESW
jgi:hypothetical protein